MSSRHRVSSPVTSGPQPNPVEWKRTLYERQPFEDNYVDPIRFLQEVKKNANVCTYCYSDVVIDTFVVIQQLSIVVVFANMFVAIMHNQVALGSIVVVDLVAGGGAIAFFAVVSNQHREGPSVGNLPKGKRADDFPGQAGGADVLWDTLRQCGVITAAVLLLSPIYQTLTVSYTDDTIWALTMTSLAIHILMADYNYLNGYASAVKQGVSMNAAIFASILLASRIPSAAFASALIGFGTICFLLSPPLRHYLKVRSLIGHVGITFLMCGVALGCLTDVPLLAFTFVVGLFLTSGAVPWFFVTMQHRFKFQINGPWDEAKPQNSAAAAEWANAGLLA